MLRQGLSVHPEPGPRIKSDQGLVGQDQTTSRGPDLVYTVGRQHGLGPEFWGKNGVDRAQRKSRDDNEQSDCVAIGLRNNTVRLQLKGVEKKTTWRFRSDRSSEKNNLSKIEKTGGQSQRAEGSLAAPCFFNF